MGVALPVKYRPSKFEDVIGQDIIVKILQKQIETKQFKNCYLFYGGSGCGKTTLARILAYKINEYRDENGNLCSAEPIEIDAASNNGVDSIRQITESAYQRSLDGTYKVFIIDECHSITTQGWQALLKTIEETPKYTIFMFCTTEYNKVPDTIKNRCQQFGIQRISLEKLVNRLIYICNKENIVYEENGLEYIAKLSNGSMRLAIANLEKCISYSSNVTVNNTYDVLGNFSYDVMFDLLNSIIDKNKKSTLECIEKLYTAGEDLKVFLDLFTEFVLDVDKYSIFNSTDIIKIPDFYTDKLKYTVNVENPTKYFNYVLDKLLNIKQIIKGDSNFKSTIEISLLNI